jgi:probable phosphoglycerate mutase
VRHGRTQYNEEGRIQGWCDSALTVTGVEETGRTAEFLRAVPFRAAYASPSGRTLTTAKMLLRDRPHTPCTVEEGLREFSYGIYEAGPEERLYSQIDVVTMYRQVFEGTFPALPGGESGARFLRRVARTFLAIEQADHGGGPVLVVSHGVTLMAYLAMIHQVPARPLANASVTTVEVDGGARRVDGTRFDPSGAAPAQPEVTLNAAQVAIEHAAAWELEEPA